MINVCLDHVHIRVRQLHLSENSWELVHTLQKVGMRCQCSANLVRNVLAYAVERPATTRMYVSVPDFAG